MSINNKREVRKIKAVTCRQLKRDLVELQRTLEVVNPHHGVNNFGQFLLPCRVMCDAAWQLRRD
jgi:hypothetical protein